MRYILAIVLIFSFTTCGKVEKKDAVEKAYVVFAIGDVKILPGGANPKSIGIKDVVKAGDVLKTGKESHLTIQIGNATIVKLQPESILKASSLLKSKGNVLFLEKGRVLSKVTKLQKDYIYKIKTPTTTASVRGTEFSVAYKPGESRVAVRMGRVNVERTDKADKKTHNKVLNEGITAIIRDDIKTRPISKIESLEIEKVSLNEIVDDIELKSKSELKESGDRLKPKEDEIDKKIKKLSPPKTLSEMKAKYKRIDLITLYSGKTIKGVIISRGATYKIMTTRGVVRIPQKKIKGTRVVR